MFKASKGFAGLYLKEAKVSGEGIIGKSVKVGDTIETKDGTVTIDDVEIHFTINQPDVIVHYSWKANGKTGKSSQNVSAFQKAYTTK